MMSTEDAAKVLGVSKRRVQALIAEGLLEAQKVSGVWLIDDASVEQRAKTADRAGGRPARGTSRTEFSFTLMNRGHEVSELVYSSKSKQFTYAGDLLDVERAPIGLSIKRGRLQKQELNDWWRNRGIPQTRIGLAQLLEDAAVELPAELLYRNLGLSLSDQYWIRPAGSGLAWEDVNFFTNGFDKVSVTTEPYAVEGKGAAAKPDNTSDGNLEKHWGCPDGVRTLFKGGTLYGQEPYNEVVATALHRRLLEPGEYVPYKLEGTGAHALCSCPNFLAGTEEYVPAVYVDRALADDPNASTYKHFVACCEALGVADAPRALDRMIVCDDILANHDRHFRNFGIVRDVETLECRMAPIFDSGSSLWCNVGTDALAAGERSYVSRQFGESSTEQRLLVRDWSWVDADALAGFVDEACEIMGANDALGERLPHIRRALEWRVGSVENIVRWYE